MTVGVEVRAKEAPVSSSAPVLSEPTRVPLLEPEAVFSALQTTADGLDGSTAEKLLARVGPNRNRGAARQEPGSAPPAAVRQPPRPAPVGGKPVGVHRRHGELWDRHHRGDSSVLAIDLGTSTLPALALGVERPEPDVMTRPPRKRSESLLDGGSLLLGYVFLSFLNSVVVLGAFFLFLLSRGWTWGQDHAPTAQVGLEATTIVFLGIVLMQAGNGFACHTERASAFQNGLFSNRFLLWGTAIEVAFAAVLIYVGPFQGLFGTTAVEVRWWVFLLACAPLIFLAEEARKAIMRRVSARQARG